MCSKCSGTGIAREYYRTVPKDGQPFINPEARVKGVKRNLSVTFLVWERCTCERGQKLGELWKKYPAWQGAPYEFFEEEINENSARI